MKKEIISILCLIYLIPYTICGQYITSKESELFQQALNRAEQANETFTRGLRNTNAWLSIADPTTLLIPDRMGQTLYTPHNSAADNYPFMILSSYCADQNFYLTTARDMLFNELRYATLPNGLPCNYDIKTRKQSGGTIFGASEYIKDGLIPVTELIGHSIWSERMINLVDVIIENSNVETNYGLLPATSCEINGEILQAVSRLYTMTGKKEYLEFIERIGDAYCFEVIPRNYGIPARNWDFTNKTPIPTGKDDPYIFRLSDHGNEIISGLVQLYITAKYHHPEKAQLYYGPVKTMLDRLANYGMREDGLFHHDIDIRTGKPVRDRTTHAWGYVYIAYLAFYQETGERKYRDYIEHVLNNLDPRSVFWWTKRSTALSDVIEGVLYIVNRIPNENGFKYIDAMNSLMLSRQKLRGEFEQWYGDGNITRTALMYAMYKTQGLRMQPWELGLKFGAVYKNNTLYIAIHSENKWEGNLFFDYPRHREIFHLPINYARINEFPEWYTIEPFDYYNIENLKNNRTYLYPGLEMIEGINLSLTPGETLYLKVNHSKK